jgi:cell division protease FtsH
VCRFDRSIEVRRPDYQGRLEGIKVHLREKPIAADIDYAELATLTGGMSGAQLAGAYGAWGWAGRAVRVL